MNQWESMIDRILHSNVASYVYGGFMPNIQIGVNAVNENPVPAEERWFQEIVQGVVFGIADATNRGLPDQRFTFCRNPRYDETLEAAYERYSLARNESVQGLIIGAVYEHGVNLGDTLATLDVLAQPEVFAKLPKSQAYVQTQGALAARQRKISELTSGGAKNFTIQTPNGNSIRYDTKGFIVEFSSSGGLRRSGPGFEGMDDAAIDTLYTQFQDQQRFKSMSVEELKAVVRDSVQQNYADKYRINPQTGMPVAHEAPTETLIDFRDGSVIDTRRKLIAFINASPENSRRLLTQNGKSVPSKIRAFELLLNSR